MSEGKKKRSSSSIYKGVNFNTRSGLFCASITHKTKRHYLGGFETARKAIQIRDAYILKHNLDVPLQVLSRPVEIK